VRPIAIAAGGTGGHFFPAEALAAELLARGHRVVLLTDARSGGLASGTFAACEKFVLYGAGIAGRGVLRAASAAVSLTAGAVQARMILSRLDAAVLVGFGGYPSVAPVLATRLLQRRPCVLLHEQNAVLGRANRVLSRLAHTLALSFSATSSIPPDVRTELTGNPVRPGISAIAGAPYPPPGEETKLLVLGGSLGARVFSEIVPSALASLAAPLRARLRVTQQCRAADLDLVRASYAASGIEAELAPFFADVPALLASASLVISRAGASTVAELAAVGRPSVLVPLPIAIDDHQTANARALEQAGGAWLVPQPAFTAATLAERLSKLLEQPAQLADAAARAASLGRADAAARLADLVERATANAGEHAA
jgi:UDP-N-acetylglucosamine--N-acetylmuramyl-(pentapeptide) pyrophosphoryl-undecaprenol N-acetylglucosamine transferase